jgi:hypothetical protein
LGIFTVGVVPNAPDTVTEEFEFELLAAALEPEPELELELALEDGLEEPQPAMTKQASAGITTIDRRRRMKNLNGGGRQAQSAYWVCRSAGHIPAMSFSTRSSTERNGSLHSTVRCAWSFSFR